MCQSRWAGPIAHAHRLRCLMWFPLLWITWSRKVRVQAGQGYFNCPSCRSRQPCALTQTESRKYLYGLIPVSAEAVGPEYYFCQVAAVSGLLTLVLLTTL